MSKAIHIICGKCGCDDMFRFTVEINECVEIYAHCENCGEVTNISDEEVQING